MVKQASLVSELAEIIGGRGTANGTKADAVDGVIPEAVASPGTYEEACRLLAHANERRVAVIPLGGRQHAGLGNMPARYAIALDTRRLSGVVEFEPADLTITVRAGTILGELRAATAASGLTVPFDPSIPDDATVGGVLAANVSGPARVSLGQPRDFTIGMRVVAADGRLTRAGGKVVKNVAGYDLCKLYIGSLGTLAVIVEATFKTVPLPQKQLALAFGFADPGAACRHVSDAVRAGLKVRSALLTREASYIELAGTPEAVARSEFDIAAAASKLGAAQIAAAPPKPLDAPVIARIEALPSRLPALLSEAATAFPDADIAAQPWDGVCRIGVSEAGAIEAVRAIAVRHGGPCVVECCPAEAKRALDVFGPRPPAFELMRAVKRELDPNGVLSPGRFVGRL
ncbi:MAG TPA: FAD-binding oxidoreductase [Dehalococcoidia bacterium]|nr:FAD-binding oxidoreductase [Dehalococcoidia bacterium]